MGREDDGREEASTPRKRRRKLPQRQEAEGDGDAIWTSIFFAGLAHFAVGNPSYVIRNGRVVPHPQSVAFERFGLWLVAVSTLHAAASSVASWLRAAQSEEGSLPPPPLWPFGGARRRGTDELSFQQARWLALERSRLELSCSEEAAAAEAEGQEEVWIPTDDEIALVLSGGNEVLVFLLLLVAFWKLAASLVPF